MKFKKVLLFLFICFQFCSKKNNTPQSLLFQSVKNGNLAKINIAIAKGADIQAKDKNGNSVLMLACKQETPRVAKFLVYSTQINVNSQNHNGDTALIIAARNGNSAIVRFLLSKKSRARAKTKSELVDINVKNKAGETALTAAKKNGFLIIVRLLRQAGAKQ